VTTVQIQTTGMYCPSCPMLIELSVGDLPGVSAVKVSAANCVTFVTFDESVVAPNTIVNEIRKAGYGADCTA
jgi:copper chaperone CopZ